MQLTPFTHITKRKMDSRHKAGYYTAVLSGKVYGVQVLRSSMRAPFSAAQEVIIHLHLECRRSKQDLVLTEVNKPTCMHQSSLSVLMLHRPHSSLPLKMAA